VRVTRNRWVIVAVVSGLALVWFAVSWEPGTRSVKPEPELPSVQEPAPAGRNAAPAQTAPNAPPTRAPGEPASTTPNAEPTPLPNQEHNANSAAKIRAPERSGPVDELKQLFGSEPRASGATSIESTIEAPFRRPEVPAGLFKSVICRTTVCKVETRWSPDGAQGFLAAVMRLVMAPTGERGAFEQNLGISPEGEAGPDGSRAIDVYLKRSAPATQPAAEPPTRR
jgi:hypothetical protein